MSGAIITVKDGQEFGNLVATGRRKVIGRNGFLEVVCSHGKKYWVLANNLKDGRTRSCRNRNCSLPTKGTAFGELIVIRTRYDDTRKHNKAMAEVVCRHNRKEWIPVNSLLMGRSTSCRKWKKCFVPPKGAVFGQLTVTTGKERRQGKRAEIEVVCRHGKTQWVRIHNLKSGTTRGCHRMHDRVLVGHQ
jgi:hypothetical protein